MRNRAFLAVLMCMTAGVWGEVSLPSFFTSNMVFQRDTTAPVWGWGAPGEEVNVTASWGEAATARTDQDGNWRAQLKTPAAGGPYNVTISGTNTIELDNVLSGEVWLCSGQSNMQWNVRNSNNSAEEVAAATYPRIRLLSVHLVPAEEPQTNCKVTPWVECSPETIPGFTAAGYFFGRKLHQDLDVPIGLINSSWGGTCIEAWTPWDAQKDDPIVAGIRDGWDKRDAAYDPEMAKTQYEEDKKAWKAWNDGGKEGKQPPRPRAPGQPRRDRNHPANLFNMMINPLATFALRGAIWYQGESNAGRGKHYRVQMEYLIASWRQLWGYDFPFYMVQLPNFHGEWKSPVEDGGWPQIRESFMKTAKEVPNTGIAVTIDIGDPDNIHPRNKQDVGDRLARLALHKTYGKSDFAWCGPIFESCEFRNGKAYVTFDTGGAPLAAKGDGPLYGFALTGSLGVSYHADAMIKGTDTVVVSSDKVPDPCIIHYAWANNPVGVNLANAGGLPASPFRFGELPTFDVFAKVCPEEAKAYKIVYAVDPTTSRFAAGGTQFIYAEDHSKSVKSTFSKVAYFMGIQKRDGNVQYAFVSMDPFTDDLTKIGVPAKATGAKFQQKVTGVTVKSNVEGVSNGDFAEGCNIEFWDSNYGPGNGAKIEGAEAAVFDFGDQPSDKSPGHGCMQIHNWKEKHSIICFNKFGSGSNNEVGIGNSEGKTRDWTFTSSAKNLARGQFLVLVLP